MIISCDRAERLDRLAYVFATLSLVVACIGTLRPAIFDLVKLSLEHTAPSSPSTFKYNASAAISLDGSSVETGVPTDPGAWMPLVPKTRLQPDTRHVLPVLDHRQPVTLVRIDAFPDGGLSRVRLWGAIDPAARAGAGLRWFNSLPGRQAVQCLVGSGVSAEVAAAILAERPLSRNWLRDTLHGKSGSGPKAAAAIGNYGQLLTGILQGRAIDA